MEDSKSKKDSKALVTAKGWKSHKTVSADLVKQYAQLGMSMPEIASRVGVSLQTMHRHFKAAYTEGQNTLDDAIRGKIMKKALQDGYWPAMRYLARTRLGWKVDSPDEMVDKLDELKETLETIYVAEFGSVIDVTPENKDE